MLNLCGLNQLRILFIQTDQYQHWNFWTGNPRKIDNPKMVIIRILQFSKSVYNNFYWLLCSVFYPYLLIKPFRRAFLLRLCSLTIIFLNLLFNLIILSCNFYANLSTKQLKTRVIWFLKGDFTTNIFIRHIGHFRALLRVKGYHMLLPRQKSF